MSDELSHKPLSGIRVLEVSRFVTASMATVMLADQGADVIKVEDVQMGDQLRYAGTRKGNISALFASINRGKRSLAVNLQTPEGQQIVQKLAEDVDVFVHNFRPGVTDRLGLGSEALRQRNPKLIYIALNGFGPTGPLAKAPAFDLIIQALAGFTATQAEDGKPQLVKSAVCDKVASYTACQAATSALFTRTRTGKGQHIDIAMMDACLYFLWPDGMTNQTFLDPEVAKAPPIGGNFSLFNTADGAVAISPATEAHVAAFLEVAKRQDLAQDERFATPVARGRNTPLMLKLLKDAFKGYTSAEVCRELASRDVPCAPCLELDDVVRQPQVVETGAIQKKHHATLGDMNVMSFPILYGGKRSDQTAAIPGHGEHTADILTGLGYNSDDIAKLSESKVIRLAK